MIYKARDLLHLSVDEIWSLPDGLMTLELDDGIIETTTRLTIFSWYCWAVQRHYPKAPLLIRHHIGNERLGSRTHMKLAGYSYWDCFDAYNADIPIVELSKLTYQLTNDIYNDFTIRLEAYVNTISILDFIDVVQHPTIKALTDNAKPTPGGIEHSYNGAWAVLTDPNELPGNAVGNAAKSAFVSRGQILQCCIHRGFVTDRDSTIFPKPIMRSYVRGLREMVDMATDSRSATIALSYTKGPLATVEYFNRKMQLGAGSIRRVYRGDCGSQEYMEWLVRPSDLKTLLGKYYVSETGVLKPIRPEDKQLVGKTIRIRAVNHCHTSKRDSVCSTCFGELAYSMPKDAALGHICVTTMCEEASQGVLSTKHELGTATANEFIIPAEDAAYLCNGSDATNIHIAPTLPLAGVKLILDQNEMPNINEINIIGDVRSLPLTRVSNLSAVGIQRPVYRASDPEPTLEFTYLGVSMGSRLSSLSYDMLEYIRSRGWELLPNGNYAVDLSDWDADLPAFVLPMKHTSMVAYLNDVESVIRATKRVKKGKGMPTLKNYDTVDDAVRALYNLVNGKLFVNLAHIEIIVRSTLVVSSKDGDYRTPLWNEPWEFSSYGDNMMMRSLGGAMAYQTQSDTLMSPKSFIYHNRPSHVMDDMLLP